MNRDNRDFLRLLRELELSVDLQTRVLAQELIAIVLGPGDVRTKQVMADRALSQFFSLYSSTVVDGAAAVAALQAAANDSMLIRRLRAAGAINEADRMHQLFAGYREEVRQRFPYQRNPVDKRTFVGRVGNIERGFRELVYDRLGDAVDAGADPRKVAFQLRDYVKPDLKLSGLAAQYSRELRNVPGSYVYLGAPGGSLQYNAMRIVRTEMARIYRQATVDFYEGRPYNEGYDWLLSNRHPHTDRCDGYADASPYKTKAEVPQSHPHCLCRVVARIMSLDKLEALVASGVIG